MEKRTLTLKDSAIALLIAFLISQLFVIIGELIISAILATINYTQSQINAFFNTAFGYMLSAILQLSAFVSVFIYYCKKTSLKKDCFEKKINAKHAIIFIIIGIITSFALTNFINYYSLVLNLFNKPTTLFPYEINNIKNYLLSIVSLAIFPAIGEELIFRGIIFNGLKQKGTLFAIIVSSLFFTLFHFNLSQLFYPFLFGLILGFVYSKTKNLSIPIIIHFVNNALNISIQYFSKSESFQPNTLNLIFMILGVFIYIAIISYFFISNYKQEKQTNNSQNKNNSIKMLRKDMLSFWLPIVFMVFLYIILI